VLYDLEINPNRPDAMSVAGVARDLAARKRLPFSLPDPKPATVPADRVTGVTVEILDPDRCGRFEARVLRDVAVGPGDPTLARRLAMLGMRSINNVVDVSNYVMLELGQPSHPYDLGKVAGQGFRVRLARPDETLTTLDDVERRLTTEDLLICDGRDEPIGIGGIMGGASSEIDDATTEVLLEMAWFDPIGIVKSSRRHKLRSEASARFEKGCDPEVVDLAMRRFAELLGSPLEEAATVATGTLPVRRPVRMRTARVAKILGTELSRERISELLDPIGFTTTPAGDDLEVEIPSWRYDSEVEIDVIEEIARHHGYTALGRTLPRAATTGGLSARQAERRRLRSLLVGHGLSEAMPMPFLAPGELAACGLPDTGITIANPLVAEQSVLRTALLPGLVGAVAYNWSHRNHGVRLFEIGHTFNRPATPGAELPDERECLGAVLAGREAPEAVHLWQVVAEALAVDGARLENAETAGYHPTRAARILVGDVAVGAVGEIDPGVLETHGIGERVACLEVDLDTLLDLPHGARQFRRFSLFPSSDIDLAFEVDDDVPASVVEDVIRAAGGDLLWSVRLFDVYRGAGVAEGTRSLAYALRLQAPDRTLTDVDLADARHRIITSVESRLGASLRG
jgi:phenylalanyl-tRNA synthetase beta chain